MIEIYIYYDYQTGWMIENNRKQYKKTVLAFDLISIIFYVYSALVQ